MAHHSSGIGVPVPATISLSDSRTFRAKRGPAWVCVVLAAFLLAMAAVVLASCWNTRAPDGHGRPYLVLGLVVTAILAGPALYILKLGRDLFRTHVAVSPDGLDLCVSRFRIWALRPMGAARLRWADVRGVQEYDIPNPMAPRGRQADYVLHTRAGEFVVSSMQFRHADRIAAIIAAHVGRPVGDLPPDVTPVGANRPADRRGIRLMRAFGWVSLVLGYVVMFCLALIWVTGTPLESSEVGGMISAGLVLLLAGRSLRQFNLK